MQPMQQTIHGQRKTAANSTSASGIARRPKEGMRITTTDESTHRPDCWECLAEINGEVSSPVVTRITCRLRISRFGTCLIKAGLGEHGFGFPANF